MPFKIVRTIERGKHQLSIVPSQWENGGILKWPKRGAEKLVIDQNSIPRPEWFAISCKVKRQNLASYEAADAELQVMLNNTDTEQEDEQTTIRRPGPSREVVNFNDLAEHLVLPQNISEVQINQANGSEETYIIQLPDNPENQAPERSSDIQQLLQNQTVLMEITNNIAINLNKVMQKLASLSVQVGETTSIINNHLYSKVTTLKEASGTENESFTLKQIKNARDLDEMEGLLSDDEYNMKLIKTCSIVCNGGIGSGVNCAYRLSDVLFSREFLCECSWSGSTRQDGVKISLKCYKKTVNFFFKMVHHWDNTYTQQDNESFFKNILKNANKRKCAKNERIPTKRRRSKGVKNAKVQESNKTSKISENRGAEEISPCIVNVENSSGAPAPIERSEEPAQDEKNESDEESLR